MAIKTLKEREREHLQAVLKKTSWNLDKTARLLQIPLSQVKRKIREHGFTVPLSERSSSLSKPHSSRSKEG